MKKFYGTLKELIILQQDSSSMNEDQNYHQVKLLLKKTRVLSKIMILRVFDFFDFLSIRRDCIEKENAHMDMKKILIKFKEVLGAQKTAKKEKSMFRINVSQLRNLREILDAFCKLLWMWYNVSSKLVCKK